MNTAWLWYCNLCYHVHCVLDETCASDVGVVCESNSLSQSFHNTVIKTQNHICTCAHTVYVPKDGQYCTDAWLLGTSTTSNTTCFWYLFVYV